MTNNQVLITGTNGSLGGYLAKKYKKPICINRSTPITDTIIKNGVDTIIHCAFNSDLDDLENLNKKSYDDNINLTYLLTKIPHNKFVYISSVQIPPTFLTPYAIQKQISEYIVQDYTNNYCILRVSSFLPQPNNTNTFYKISKGKDISLTKNSVNDVIYCEDIYKAIESNLNGTLYLVSREPITIEDTAKLFKRSINYGKYHYNIGDIKSDIDIGKSSAQILTEFFNL